MSRSRHQTVKGVFGGKPASEINAMIDGGDADVQALREKKGFKRDEQDRRCSTKRSAAGEQ
ncbi:MAG: hypothetical protein ACREEO_09475 [Phenylobacterium sp.]